MSRSDVSTGGPSGGRRAVLRRASWVVLGCGALIAALHWGGPALFGGVREGDRERIATEWAALLERVPPREEAAEWAGSALARWHAGPRTPDRAAELLGALGDGASAPLPPRESTTHLMTSLMGVELDTLTLAEVEGILRYGRRMQRGATDLLSLLSAAVVLDRVLMAAEGDEELAVLVRSVARTMGAPTGDEFEVAFLREEVGLESWLDLLQDEAGEDELEVIELALKLAVLEEVRWQTALASGADLEVPPGPAGPGPPVVPGRLALYFELWLARPEGVARTVIRPVIAAELEGPRASWLEHVARWEALASGG